MNTLRASAPKSVLLPTLLSAITAGCSSPIDTAEGLTSALASARPGDVVELAAVTIEGGFDLPPGVTLLGQSMATKDIREGGFYAGSPARPASQWRKAVAAMYANLNKKRE